VVLAAADETAGWEGAAALDEDDDPFCSLRILACSMMTMVLLDGKYE
jgi:hypothetical protein